MEVHLKKKKNYLMVGGKWSDFVARVMKMDDPQFFFFWVIFGSKEWHLSGH